MPPTLSPTYYNLQITTCFFKARVGVGSHRIARVDAIGLFGRDL